MNFLNFLFNRTQPEKNPQHCGGYKHSRKIQTESLYQLMIDKELDCSKIDGKKQVGTQKRQMRFDICISQIQSGVKIN